LQEILNAERSAKNALKRLRGMGCDLNEITRLLDNFRYAYVLEGLRKPSRPSLRRFRASAWNDLFGLSPEEARTFRGRLDRIAEQVKRVNKVMPFVLPSIVERPERVAVKHAIRWLPGILQIYGAAFERLIRVVRSQLGRKNFNLARDQERLLVGYIKNKTGAPHYREAEVLLSAVQEALPGRGSDRGGEAALEMRCRRTKDEPVSIETLFQTYPALGQLFLTI